MPKKNVQSPRRREQPKGIHLCHTDSFGSLANPGQPFKCRKAFIRP